MKLWTIYVQLGVSKAIGLDVPNFVKNVPRVLECVLRLGLTSNHFLMDSKMKLWTIHVQMGVLKALRSDVLNFIKDVPNFVKNVPRVP